MAEQKKRGRPPKKVDPLIEVWTCTMQENVDCAKANGVRKKADFYMATNNRTYKADKVHICKSCIKDYVSESNGKVTLAKFKNILRLLDMPFLEDVWAASLKSHIGVIGGYFKNIALNHQNKGYDDGEIAAMQEIIMAEFDLTDEVRKFWGPGFTAEDYEFLNVIFEDLINDFECNDVSTEMLFKDIATTRLIARKELLKNNANAYEKLTKVTKDLMKEADISPASAKGSGSTNQIIIGNLIKKLETEKPVANPLQEWVDNNQIKKYINVFFFGQLARAMGKKTGAVTEKEFEEELKKYTVEREDD